VYYISGWLVVQIKSLERSLSKSLEYDKGKCLQLEAYRSWLYQNIIPSLEEANKAGLPVDNMKDIAI
jgi:hypothetical protein